MKKKGGGNRDLSVSKLKQRPWGRLHSRLEEPCQAIGWRSPESELSDHGREKSATNREKRTDRGGGRSRRKSDKVRGDSPPSGASGSVLRAAVQKGERTITRESRLVEGERTVRGGAVLYIYERLF